MGVATLRNRIPKLLSTQWMFWAKYSLTDSGVAHHFTKRPPNEGWDNELTSWRKAISDSDFGMPINSTMMQFVQFPTEL